MLRHIYVEEAELSLMLSHPGRNVSLSKLALVTGIDTRTVTNIRKNIYEQKARFTQLPLKELTPESALVEAWVQVVETDPLGNEKKVLSYDGPDSEFERLFKSTISSRGITVHSLINRLVATKSVKIDKKNKKITLLVTQFSPFLSDDEPNIINAALSAISNLVSTIDNNVGANQEDKFFQRQTWTFRLSPNEREKFRSTMKAFLENVDFNARSKIESWEQPEFQDELVTAGVGFYYFEESG
jgi:hypothetical protein